MLSLGGLAFTAPWLLLALGLLPLLWWLLRVTPPAPRQVRFPAIRLLFRLREKEDTPAHTPWWLLLLRLAVAALLILGLAHPLLNPSADFRADGPLVLVIDDGWDAGPGWERRGDAAGDLLDQAERQGRQVILVRTSRAAAGAPIEASRLMAAAEARSQYQAMLPNPWPADHEAAREAVDALSVDGGANVVFLSSGLRHEGTDALIGSLQRLGRVTVVADRSRDLPVLLRPDPAPGEALTLRVVRADGTAANTLWARAVADDGRVLSREQVSFEAGATEATLSFDVPSEIRNRISRIEIESQRGAGSVYLLDERSRRRPAGLAHTTRASSGQPLLSDIYYLDRALNPYTELRTAPIGDLLQRPLSIIFWPDATPASTEERERLTRWIENGGVLVRFAGPVMADSDDDLVPVRLRRGNRSFGGAMSWTNPATLAAFEAASPFSGLEVPEDVTVRRQVLAQPTVELNAKTWARLSDGTPLVTAARQGQGMIVLVHTSAHPGWSNLPLSGLFVNMLRRIVAMSQGVSASDDEEARMLPPTLLLDGLGRLGPATEAALPINASQLDEVRISPDHPPGFYGEQAARRAVNLSNTVESLTPLGGLPAGVERAAVEGGGEVDLRPPLLILVLALFLVDLVLSFFLRGLVNRQSMAPRAAAVAVAALLLPVLLLAPAPAGAQQEQVRDDYAIRATQETVFAYVRTGNPAVDRVSEAGLRGLGRQLERRTSVEPGDPMGVNPETDPLAFFPLLYWPITESQSPPSDAAAANLQSFLQSGGMIVFDIRVRSELGSDTFDMRAMVEGIQIPALRVVPEDHVLTRSYYLLQRFPGRWADGRVWVARDDEAARDGVSPVIIGSNDWAGAWAVDQFNRPMFPVVPGGEYQREMAYRVGINIVMYALTGNYKGDQVHLPTIMRRLGQ